MNIDTLTLHSLNDINNKHNHVFIILGIDTYDISRIVIYIKYYKWIDESLLKFTVSTLNSIYHVMQYSLPKSACIDDYLKNNFCTVIKYCYETH